MYAAIYKERKKGRRKMNGERIEKGRKGRKTISIDE